jgi:probable addiction module antidote protein
MKTKDYRAGLLKRLQDEEYAVGYLTDVLTHETPEAFLIALKDVIDARGENVSALAKQAGVTRQALYQALSEDGNPRFSTITQILKVLNLQFAGLQIADESEKEAA